jgi:hypothetical protein
VSHRFPHLVLPLLMITTLFSVGFASWHICENTVSATVGGNQFVTDKVSSLSQLGLTYDTTASSTKGFDYYLNGSTPYFSSTVLSFKVSVNKSTLNSYAFDASKTYYMRVKFWYIHASFNLTAYLTAPTVFTCTLDGIEVYSINSSTAVWAQTSNGSSYIWSLTADFVIKSASADSIYRLANRYGSSSAVKNTIAIPFTDKGTALSTYLSTLQTLTYNYDLSLVIS